ncbi:MAG: DNA repair and recombination protein RadB [Nanoarchaeota archaeon]
MSSQRLSTGTEILDVLLDGGYENDAITTIYGPAGAGKTNFALLAAVNVAKLGKKVIYIDTEGGFSIARLEQLVPNYKKTKVLEKIIFLQPTNFDEQKKAFEKLRNIVNSSIGLIVVDTLTMLYRLQKHTTGEVHDVNGELAIQIGFLNEIARKKLIPVLVTNHVYTGFDDGISQIVGGDLVKYSSKCIVELQTFHAGKRKAILRKHRSIAGEKEVLFEIVESGVRGI